MHDSVIQCLYVHDMMTWLSFKSSILGVLHRANESIKFRYCSILSSTLDYGYTNFHKFKQLEKLNTFALFSCYIRHNSSFAHEANSSENTILWRKMSTHQTFFHVQQMMQGYSKNTFWWWRSVAKQNIRCQSYASLLPNVLSK